MGGVGWGWGGGGVGSAWVCKPCSSVLRGPRSAPAAENQTRRAEAPKASPQFALRCPRPHALPLFSLLPADVGIIVELRVLRPCAACVVRFVSHSCVSSVLANFSRVHVFLPLTNLLFWPAQGGARGEDAPSRVARAVLSSSAR